MRRLAVCIMTVAQASVIARRQLPAPSQLRVAVCGAGISGSLVARRLAEAGAAVTVVEAGRGPGGRTSSRRADVGGKAVHFDHGASYFSPKSEAFAATVAEWVAAGAAAEWRGRFGALALRDGAWRFDRDEGAKARYVGTPRMSAIPRHLLAHPRVSGVFGKRVLSAREAEDGWVLGDDTFDVLVSSDRLMGAKPETTRVDTVLKVLEGDTVLEGVASEAFSSEAAAVTSTRALVCMLGFAGAAAEALASVPLDAALVDGDSAVAYVSRDSSKPGRDADGVELWVVHAAPAFAERALDDQAAAVARGEDAAAALDRWAPELVAAVGDLFAPWVVGDLPAPDFCALHRWGAAFPNPQPPGAPAVVADRGGTFVAIGDWRVSPRVEGAAVSAEAGARHILDACAPES